MIKKEKTSKNNILNSILLILIIIVVGCSTISLCKTIPKLQELNHSYTEQTILYKEQTDKQKQLKNITDAGKKELADQKAREDGYSYANDMVFYDVS